MAAAFIVFGAKYLIIAPITLVLLYAFFAPPKERAAFLLRCLIGLPLAYVLAKIGSHFYFDPRPFITLGIPPLIPHAADNGFPSDHTLLAASLAAAMTLHRWKMGACLWILAILIGVSRVLALVHHPVDIAGSIVFAIFGVGAAYLATRRFYA